jgi:PAS domain S-box-containing protein
MSTGDGPSVPPAPTFRQSALGRAAWEPAARTVGDADPRGDDEAAPLRADGFRLVVEAVRDYAIFLLDPNGRVLSWNAGAERIKGYTAGEIIGQSFSVFYPPDVAARGHPQHELETARRDGRFEVEGWRVRKDGSLFWANVVITALTDSSGRHQGFLKITRDLTGQRRVEALELAEQRVNEFLAMLGHELRNPLAPIRNALAVMHMKPVPDPNLQWARDVIDRQLRQLTRMVDDLIDVSRITSGTIALNKEPLELAVVVARGVEASRPLIDARRQHLEIDYSRSAVLVEGDLARLAQVVTNLLNNAARFTPEDGTIRLSVASDGDWAVLSVRDNGAGIDAALRPHIFDLFRQGDSSLDRAEGGLGIGLTIVQRLAQMHGGTVDVFSEGPGRGSEFVVRLPRLDGLPPRMATPSGRVASIAQSATPRRVLVVDDSPDSAESMAAVLRLCGHEVRAALNGPGAIALARHFRPEVALLDIGIPGMTGYEVAAALRELPGMEALVLIAMTGYGQAQDRMRSREAGFQHHLVKPVEIADVHHVLESLPPVRTVAVDS